MSFSLSFVLKNKQLSWYHSSLSSSDSFFESWKRRQTKINLHYAISFAQLRMTLPFTHLLTDELSHQFLLLKIARKRKVLFFFCLRTQENIYVSSLMVEAFMAQHYTFFDYSSCFSSDVDSLQKQQKNEKVSVSNRKSSCIRKIVDFISD